MQEEEERKSGARLTAPTNKKQLCRTAGDAVDGRSELHPLFENNQPASQVTNNAKEFRRIKRLIIDNWLD